MQIREVLELTQQKTIAEIAKNDLTIGEKLARQALREAGCYTIVGKPGWIFDDTENPENFHKSIYYFADQVKKEQSGILKDAANLPTYEQTDTPAYRKRHSFDLDVRLMKQLKLRSVQQDKPLYLVVEEAVRDYLQKDDAE